jgi:Sulfotransferase domain
MTAAAALARESSPSVRWVPVSHGWPGAPGLLYRALRGTRLVISYPKSGRTWLRVMLDALGVDAEYTHFGAGVKAKQPLEGIRANPLWCRGRPSLLLVRDPRDTLVSSYFQAVKRRGVYSGEISEFVRDPRFGIEKLAGWNLMWAELAQARERFGIVSYEALHREPGATLLGVARMLGSTPSDAELAAAVEAGRIDVMRARERRGEYAAQYGKALTPADPADTQSFKVRLGVVGGYRASLSPSDVAFCEATLERLGYWARLDAAAQRVGIRPAA